MNPETSTSEAKPLIQLELEASAFAADWKHCDQAANYLARMASFDRADTFLHSNLLSTVLNELFEVIFCRHRPAGNLQCRLLREGDHDRIELEIPVSEAEREFYQGAVKTAQSGQASELYARALLNDTAPDRAIGFLELAADYDARISMEPPTGETGLRLIVDVCLENSANKNQPS